MIKKLFRPTSLIIGGVFGSAAYASADSQNVGTVTRIQSNASVIRAGEKLPLENGSIIRKNDEINSDIDTRLEITFNDGTTLIIGEQARIKIDEYLYEPADNIGTAIISALEGPFRFITGKIGELKEKRVEIKSSVGTIGVRGTDFWGGPLAGTYGVLLFEGKIVVFNSEGGRIVTAPGTGVNIDAANKLPGEVDVWSDERTQAAVATVTFK